jgi:hypothetical protein
MNEQDREFIERTKKVLDQSTDELDPSTLTALTRARAQALDHSRRNRRWLVWGAAPVAGLALATALFFNWSPPITRLDAGFVGDLGLLAGEDSIEFYEDIDFCLWLSEDSDETSDFSDAVALPAARSASAWSSSGRGAGRTSGEPSGNGTAGISRHFRGPGHRLDRPLRNTARG